MPYQSRAQQGLFHSSSSPVSKAEVSKWDAESKGQHDLPFHKGSAHKPEPRADKKSAHTRAKNQAMLGALGRARAARSAAK